jgi:hypothetical protein
MAESSPDAIPAASELPAASISEARINKNYRKLGQMSKVTFVTKLKHKTRLALAHQTTQTAT